MTQPLTIERAEWVAALQSLGIDTDHLRTVTSDPSCIITTHFRMGDDGKYVTTDLGEPATVVTLIAIR